MHFSPNVHLGKFGQFSFGWWYWHSSSEKLQFGQCLHLIFFLSSYSSTSSLGIYLILFLCLLRSITVFPSWVILTSSKGFDVSPRCCFLTLFEISSYYFFLSFLTNVSKSVSRFIPLDYLYSIVRFFCSLSKMSVCFS